MKKLITILVIAFSLKAGMLNAQIPNPGFENLNLDGSLSNWGNVYLFAVTLDSNGVAIQDSIVFDNTFYAPTTDAHTGMLAMELRNAYNYTTNTGLAGSASVDEDSVFMGWSSFELVPIQSAPSAFSFYYKYLPVNGDSGSAHLTVIDDVGNQLGEAQIIISGTVSNYTLATAPVIYSMPGIAAFYVLNFSTFLTNSPGIKQPSLGTRFLVDDVSFNMPAGINETSSNSSINIFPNPAFSEINIKTHFSKDVRYNIYNSFGQLVQQGSLQPNIGTINLDKFSNGLYSLEITTDSKIEKQNFVVSK